MTILVTGAAGFIGSALTRRLVALGRGPVIALDRLGYAACLDALPPLPSPHAFIRADIRDGAAVDAVLQQYRPQAIFHLAAETHVDRSIDHPGDFIEHNILGTFQLLEAVRRYWRPLPCPDDFRFVHVSTDEVFGSLEADDALFSTTSPYRPNSPYSASKAASDHLARAWMTTYGLPVIVTNCSNNFGPWQFPEKLIPLVIQKALSGLPLPVYGDGGHRRDWLHVDDHAAGLLAALERGQPGQTYLFGAGEDRSNLEVVNTICHQLDQLRPDPAGPRQRLISFVADRPGHDRRYGIDASHARDSLGWQAETTFSAGIASTIGWCLDHPDWAGRDYHGPRLGLS
ncbi:dTDP-glucose 4,6-dehydratase [Magnetospirillum sulfuroxidans]|uniref:dTDP-glucose 4,6-dehydratase n=1 Tax=Magnetospirillum sulfuroxidans TaxID=611300 RepID=A0ABS5IEI7_9PROT|nr:dTDP-glucose 4,6-dehydratase [Magnetospirillum sulfuroxidans]MBR9972831.1 dTDP-glucose 4,6-dehydratase [Magnetospirillum sulfuroxidans]